MQHYIGREEVNPYDIEYRRDGDGVWLDAGNPGDPAGRAQPQLTEEQAAQLVADRPDLKTVPHAEPLVFLAADARGNGSDFWERAVAAGWVPSYRSLELLTRARQLLAEADENAGPSPSAYSKMPAAMPTPKFCLFDYRYPASSGTIMGFGGGAFFGALDAAREMVSGGDLEIAARRPAIAVTAETGSGSGR